MQINLIGETYTTTPIDFDTQRRVNWMPVVNQSGSTAKYNVALVPTPGLRRVGTSAYGVCRALTKFNNAIIAVCGNAFVGITYDPVTDVFTEDLIGTIGTNSGPVDIVANSIIITIDDHSSTYQFNVPDDSFTTLIDPNLFSNTSVTSIDQYFIFAVGAEVYCTTAGDPTKINALAFQNQGSNEEPIIALNKQNGQLWIFRQTVVEPWFDAAIFPGFPFQAVGGATIDVGLAAQYSVTRLGNTLCWLDNRHYIVACQGYTPTIIGTDAIHQRISTYSDVSDAVFYPVSDGGRELLVCNFPTGGQTFVFDGTQPQGYQWHERSSLIAQNPTRHLGQYCIRVPRTTTQLVSSFNSPDFYVYDKNIFTDGDYPIQRINTTTHYANENEWIGITKYEIIASMGTATGSGQGQNPIVNCSWSKDGGHSYSPPVPLSLGTMGDYSARLRENRLGTGRRWVFKQEMTDPVYCALLAGYIEVDNVPRQDMYNVGGQNA